MNAMNKKYVNCAAVAVAVLVGRTAYATTIDFESPAPNTILSTEYAAEGVDFTGAEILALGVGNPPLDPAFPPHSGNQVVYDYPASATPGVITAIAVGADWTSVGGYITGNTVITEYAYDSHGNLLGTASTPGANYIGSGTGYSPNIFLSVSAPGIAYVEFHDTGNTFSLDDFTFQQQSVPDGGSTAILLLVGASALVGLRRLKIAA